MSVAFEKGHQGLDPVDGLPLFRGGEQPEKAGVVYQRPPLTARIDDLRHQTADPSRSRSSRAHKFGHEAQEIASDPGHSDELSPMGGFVEGDPEAEVGGFQLLLTLQSENVGPDHRNDITLVAGREDQLILAEHPARQKAEQRTGFDGRDLAGEDRRSSLGSGLLELLGDLGLERRQQMGESGEVAMGPVGSTHHENVGVAGRAEPGLGRHHDGRPLDDVGQGVLQLGGVIGVSEGIGPRYPIGHRRRQRPVDRAGVPLAHRTMR